MQIKRRRRRRFGLSTLRFKEFGRTASPRPTHPLKRHEPAQILASEALHVRGEWRTKPSAVGYVGSGLNGTLTREDAQGLMEELASSGKGLKAFAEEKGMSSSRLGRWRTKFARELREGAERGPIPAFVPVVVAARGGSAEKPSPLEVALRTGQTVRVPVGFDERALHRLMAVLEGPRSY